MPKEATKAPQFRDSGHIGGERRFFSSVREKIDLPNLIELQLDSYNWFLKEGLAELFDEISPITDFTGKNMELRFLDYHLEDPKVTEALAKERNITFEAPLRARVELLIKETGEIKEQEVFLGDFPLMTARGTFIINGVERVVVTQLVRSPGVFFTADYSYGDPLFGAKIIPNRGAWLEIETSNKDVISVKIDRKRKITITTLLRALGYGSDEELRGLFKDVDTNTEHRYIEATIEKDPAKNVDEGLIEVYKRIRPGDLATVENSRAIIEPMFFDFRRYDFGRVGRYMTNKRLNLDTPNDRAHRTLQREDLVAIVREIIRLNNEGGYADDIDNLARRRLKAVGELIQAKFRVGLLRMERMIKDRMSVYETENISPAPLINVRPVVAAIREFFASSQLSQFMDQTNPLAELSHKRRLSALGQGGLSRERAGFEVRDVHRTHYGRICPIETPEGPNIGLVGSLASYARVNDYGFIETPYQIVLSKIDKPTAARLEGQVLTAAAGGAKPGTKITKALAQQLEKKGEPVRVVPVVTNEIVYLTADEEEHKIIAQANVPINERGELQGTQVSVRRNGQADSAHISEVEYIDVSPKQIISVATALIPFVEHDAANRALMGANMQRQGVPLVHPEAPIVGTGIESTAGRDSGQLLMAEQDGTVSAVSASEIKVAAKDGKDTIYPLSNFVRGNQGTVLHQRPTVKTGDKIKKGQPLVDAAATDNTEIALGQNLVVAFMNWGGGNFEDAIIISERLVRDDRYTSIHVEEFDTEVRDTKLGEEVVTRDIPNAGEEALRDLDEEGIVRIGAEVAPGDILVGKITPKGETELTAEERLLRAIFGEKARDVKDTSLRLPNGEHGKVVDVKIFSKEQGDELSPGVIKKIQVSVAQMRKISVGDKMAGRHGNKGVISRILPLEDMPYLEDGTPVDIILNPLGVSSRMNLGQVLETHLGWAAKHLGYRVATPTFDGVGIDKIKSQLTEAGLDEDGKSVLFDGRSGDAFANKVTVGVIYMLKLHHLVEDKIHARSTGPYAMVTQQPLGGKAQFGGQRFGEMEVWALEAYGAAHTLQEILTIKSDDVVGRSKAYESIIKNEPIKEPRIPESFNVLVKELQSLGLSIDLIRTTGEGEEEEVSAETVIERGMQKDVDELKSAQMIVGDVAADQATVDLEAKGPSELEAIDEPEPTEKSKTEEVAE
jgi:DNA-directed RNA polymerase subunit beta